MDATYSQPLIEMGVSLTQLAIRGTATAVTNKIKTIKDEKSAEKIRSTYDEIVNELLSERDEAVRIAQSYKSELERIVISDEDIEHWGCGQNLGPYGYPADKFGVRIPLDCLYSRGLIPPRESLIRFSQYQCRY